jgi:hypothetical protein
MKKSKNVLTLLHGFIWNSIVFLTLVIKSLKISFGAVSWREPFPQFAWAAKLAGLSAGGAADNSPQFQLRVSHAK